MRKMKDSGIGWIGEIPESWKLIRVKHLFDIGRGRVIAQHELEESGYPVYSSQTQNYGCLGYISTYDYDRSQLTWTTDGVNAGTVFLREGKHNCTNVCGTLTPKDNTNNLKYLKYALEYIAIFHKRADTNGYKIMNNEMAEIAVTIPNKSIQDIIADYLDKKCAEIDAIIAVKEKTNELLKERRQSIIYEAVTKGLDPTVPMKDSGIEWIGEIPESWSIDKVKYCANLDSNKLSESTDPEYEFHYIDISSVTEYGGIGETTEMTFEKSPSRARMIVNDGDTIISTVRTYLKAIAYIEEVKDHICSTGFCVITPNEKIRAKFGYYLLQSDYFVQKIVSESVGVSYPAISSTEIGNIKIAIPNIQDQAEISQHLDEKCSEIDSLISANESTIEKLKEYRQSVIYEAVTGKVEI